MGQFSSAVRGDKGQEEGIRRGDKAEIPHLLL